MGQNSSIEWTDHTLNLWWGCAHISPACDHCYADGQAHHHLPQGWLIVGEGRSQPRQTRAGDPNRPEIWGPDAPRIFPRAGSPVLKAPFKWNRIAAATGRRQRAFTSSMCDVFEQHRLDEVNAAMDRSRAEFFHEVIPRCPWVDFLLLTKRPHAIRKMVPKSWMDEWPRNVWVGTTVEDQQRARQRLPHLVQLGALVRFISAEPLLGPLDLSPWIDELDWVIAGGESGPQARPTEIDWVRSLRDQATAAGMPFLFKQWGRHAQRGGQGNQLVRLRRKDFRILDGREWNDPPQLSEEW